MFTGYPPELMDDLKLRWARLQDAVRQTGADALVIGTNVNLLYFSGRVFMGYAYLPAEGAPWFFVRRPCGLTGPNVVEIRKPEQIPDLLRAGGIAAPRSLLLEGDELTFSEWTRLAAAFGGVPAANGSGVLRQCRAVKTPYELRIMKKTGSRHADVVMRFASVYEPGMTDQAWSIEMFRLMLQAGNLGLFRIAGNSMEGFMGTILAGDNGGAVSPYDFALGGAAGPLAEGEVVAFEKELGGQRHAGFAQDVGDLLRLADLDHLRAGKSAGTAHEKPGRPFGRQVDETHEDAARKIEKVDVGADEQRIRARLAHALLQARPPELQIGNQFGGVSGKHGSQPPSFGEERAV